MSLRLRFAVPLAVLLAIGSSARAEGPIHKGESNFMLGAGITTQPKYEGSDENESRAMPAIAGHYRSNIGKFSIGGTELGLGVAWTAIETSSIEAGLLVGYNRGRAEDDSRHLQGLGDVDGTAEIGAFGVYKLGSLRFRLTGVTAPDKGHGGSLLKTSVDYRWQLVERLGLGANLGMTWASDDYMQNMFGVTARQSERSGLQTYEAKSGIKSVGAGLNLDFAMNRHWGLLAGYNFTLLQGDAAGSPIVQKRNQQRLFAGVTYRW